jgi:saccharopine dehydrogenase (NAD+, L-lysine-forming)
MTASPISATSRRVGWATGCAPMRPPSTGCYMGSLRRHRETAEAMGDMGAEPEVDARLNELDYFNLAAAHAAHTGAPEPHTPEDFVDHIRDVMEAWSRAEIQGNESYADFETRVAEMLTVAARPGRRVLCVTSGGVIGMMVRHILDLDPARMAHLLVPIQQPRSIASRCCRKARSWRGSTPSRISTAPSRPMRGRISEETMTHLWVRAEERPHEARVGLTPAGAAALIAQGIDVTVEDSPAARHPDRGLPDRRGRHRRARVLADRAARHHRLRPEGAARGGRHPAHPPPHHVRPRLQGAARRTAILLRRFRAGGGTLYDLEYLTDETGRRVAAFGYWAGYAGAAVSLLAWAAQRRRPRRAPSPRCGRARDLAQDSGRSGSDRPRVLIIGAQGPRRHRRGRSLRRDGRRSRAGTWRKPRMAARFRKCSTTRSSSTASSPPGVPVFVPRSALTSPRALGVIGDIACDPTAISTREGL